MGKKTIPLYGYRLAWPRDVDPDAVSAAFGDLHRLGGQGYLHDIRRRGRVITFRTYLDLLTGGTNVVDVVIGPLGGELRATDPKPPSLKAAGKHREEKEHGGKDPTTQDTYFTHEGTQGSIAEARRRASVARSSSLVFSWRRVNDWLEVKAKVPVSSIPGWTR